MDVGHYVYIPINTPLGVWLSLYERSEYEI